jgi:CRISPR/Cas system-associated exonuclease Cas4 (RecB family)
MAFDPLVLKYAPWAVSKVNTLELCPRQFSLQYVAKEKQGPKSSDSKVGTTAHLVLEEGLKKPSTPLYEYAKKLCDEVKLLSKEAQQVIDFVPAIRGYIERIDSFKVQTGVTVHEIEHKLAISTAFEKVEFFAKENNILRGVLDQLMITRDQIAILVDHKSGKKKRIDEHNTQFNVYRILICATYPEVQGVQCGINYIGAPKLDWSPRPDRTSGAWTRREVERQLHPWLEHYLNSLVRRLKLVDQGEKEPRPGWQCSWCGYTHLCEEGLAAVLKKRSSQVSANL